MVILWNSFRNNVFGFVMYIIGVIGFFVGIYTKEIITVIGTVFITVGIAMIQLKTAANTDKKLEEYFNNEENIGNLYKEYHKLQKEHKILLENNIADLQKKKLELEKPTNETFDKIVKVSSELQTIIDSVKQDNNNKG